VKLETENYTNTYFNPDLANLVINNEIIISSAPLLRETAYDKNSSTMQM